MLDEERLIKQFAPLIGKYARRLHLPGYEPEDITQELDIAAVGACRTYNPAKWDGPLASYVHCKIRERAINLYHRFRTKKRTPDNWEVSLDHPAEGAFTPLGDSIPAPDQLRGVDFFLACESLCTSDLETQILHAIWNGDTLEGVSRRDGRSAMWISKVKSRLMLRLRREVMGA
jgi:hypothetical protein